MIITNAMTTKDELNQDSISISMEKYRLINKTTNEEHICTKVVLDGFDYYINDDDINTSDYYIGLNLSNSSVRICSNENQIDYSKHKKIIATNNPSIDLPQIEVNYDYDELGELMIQDALIKFEKKHGYKLSSLDKVEGNGDYLYFAYYETFEDTLILHYGEHTLHDCPYSVTLELPLKDSKYPIIETDNQNTHLNSDEDMIEFAYWLLDIKTFNDWHKETPPKKLLEIWKSEQPKVIYFKYKL
jgi:hypothetical protein